MRRRYCQVPLIAVLIATTLLGPRALAVEVGKVFQAITASMSREKPAMPKSPSVESFAKQVDWLEHRLETYGSVISKRPDIWGQARLTQHREEYEKEMLGKLGDFEETLQGSIRRSDSSFLALAYSLNAATGSAAGPPTTNQALAMLAPTATDPIARSATTVTNSTNPLGNFLEKQISLEPTVVRAQHSRYLNYLNHLRRINEGDDTSDAPGYALYLARLPVSVLPGKHTDSGYGAEISYTITPQLTTELLPLTFRNLVINDLVDQLSLIITKVLDDREALQELRVFMGIYNAIDWGKINEIFTADADDFAEQYATEIRARAKAAYPASQFDPSTADGKLWAVGLQSMIVDVIAEHNRLKETDQFFKGKNYSLAHNIANKGPYQELRELDFAKSGSAIQNLVRHLNISPSAYPQQTLASHSLVRNRNRSLPFPASQNPDVYGDFHVLSHLALAIDSHLGGDLVNRRQIHLTDVRSVLFDEVSAAYDFLSLPEGLHLWEHCNPELAHAIRDRRRDLRIPAEYYSPNSNGPGLNPGNERPPIGLLRSRFFNDIKRLHPRARFTATTSVAWGILCEAALLNQALIDDMARVGKEKGCACLNAEGHKFYLPKPLPLKNDWLRNETKHFGPDPDNIERPAGYDTHVADLEAAANVFLEYVRCRWPVTVFALDPMTDEQNIADQFSRRREMQLAVAVAVADGKVSPSAAGRFVRRLETDIETVALNRTAVGFSHGGDTFGWRFYPRVQTPPFQRNLGVLAESIIGPNPNQDIRTRKLEPGIRDCYAIVIMPSFVPHCTFTSRSNWFCLTNPSHKELSIHDTMQLSKAYQSVVNFSQQARDCGEYRPGDVTHIMSVVEQIGKRLPFQNELVQVPYENTVGGFELFTSGITDLGPELIGFYGAPGVDVEHTKNKPAAAGAISDFRAEQNALPFDPEIVPASAGDNSIRGTTMFIVGKHFSVTNTKFIAGGRYVPFRLLSREIAEVMIPPNVNLIANPDGRTPEFVDVHVATPYGVSNHLLIPAHRASTQGAANIESRLKKLESSQISVKPVEVTASFRINERNNIDPASIRTGSPLAISLDFLNGGNKGAGIPKTAIVVLQPLKEAGSIITSEDPVKLTKPAPPPADPGAPAPAVPPLPLDQFEISGGKIKLNPEVLDLAVRSVLAKNPVDRFVVNRAEYTFKVEFYVRLDTDGRFARVDQTVTVKLVEDPQSPKRVDFDRPVEVLPLVPPRADFDAMPMDTSIPQVPPPQSGFRIEDTSEPPMSQRRVQFPTVSP